MLENVILINKKLVLELGIETAYFHSTIAELDKKSNSSEGWFEATTEDIEKATGFTRYKQDSIIEKLITENIIEKDLKGVPAKRHLRFIRR